MKTSGIPLFKGVLTIFGLNHFLGNLLIGPVIVGCCFLMKHFETTTKRRVRLNFQIRISVTAMERM